VRLCLLRAFSSAAPSLTREGGFAGGELAEEEEEDEILEEFLFEVPDIRLSNLKLVSKCGWT